MPRLRFRPPHGPTRLVALLLLALWVSACAPSATPPAEVETAIAEVKNAHAPDRRTARFDVEATRENGSVVLAGETTKPAARDALLERLSAQGISVEDRIDVLPDEALGAEQWAVVTNSVANMRSSPGHSSELSTQALLGTPLNVWKERRGFYLVQTPDGYLGWVDGGGIERMDADELDHYRDADKIVYLPAYGFAYEAPKHDAARASDLVGGSVLEVTGRQGDYYTVRYPDGREAYVLTGEAEPYDEWAAARDPSETSLVTTARRMNGVPYLWGGTSTKGVDCSGFTKTVYFLNGMILPRDASQQVREGVVVDSAGQFDRLRPGDLLFFGRPATDSTRERVVHVGMWIGDDSFIHSSGRVHVSSISPESDHYDPYNLNRYLRTRRILGTDADVPILKEDGLYAHLRQPAETARPALQDDGM